ncbi:hypothetical protein L596_011804 [Steinernema carpocapsae]|uniref:H15 domain-containing protein n=1 Tax=Steinernema carpocapsae TaxID=34508 RepID=A0A4U5NVJ6_STECR|nr:hypothetical protein L596_011804 [Steinernema carpocapsae]
MSDQVVAPAVAAEAPKASPKKAKAPKAAKVAKPKDEKKAPASHPTYQAMIKAAIGALKEKKGSSKTAILNYIKANYKVATNDASTSAHLRAALKRGAESGFLKQTSGTGASGRFRIGDKAESKVKIAKVPKKSVAKKPAAEKKPKKAAVEKKPAGEKKAPKKVTADAKKASAVKKPAAVKKPKAAPAKKAAAPKKAAPKKAVAKKAAPKKAATKKASAKPKA